MNLSIFDPSAIESVYFLLLGLGIIVFYVFNKIQKTFKRIEYSQGTIYKVIQEKDNEILDYYVSTYLEGIKEKLKEHEFVKIRTKSLLITVQKTPENDFINTLDYNIKLHGYDTANPSERIPTSLLK